MYNLCAYNYAFVCICAKRHTRPYNHLKTLFRKLVHSFLILVDTKTSYQCLITQVATPSNCHINLHQQAKLKLETIFLKIKVAKPRTEQNKITRSSFLYLVVSICWKHKHLINKMITQDVSNLSFATSMPPYKFTTLPTAQCSSVCSPRGFLLLDTHFCHWPHQLSV